MRLNIEATRQLIKEKYRNNKAWFAEELGVDRGYFSQILNEKCASTSKKVCDSMIIYCQKNNLNYLEYIFLT